MFAILQQKYPGARPLLDRLLYSVGMSVFVFLFLLIFQPFQLGSSPINIVLVCLGYSATCFVMMLVCNILIIELLPSYFDENRWTVGREIFWILVNIVLIGLANAYFSSYAFQFPFTLYLVGVFELYTLAVAVLPVIVSVFIHFHRLRNQYEGSSAELNALFDQPVNPTKDQTNHTITLDINTTESVDILVSDIYFIQAADNYVEVYFASNGSVEKVLIRYTLKALFDELGQYPNFMQVHRSYIANLHQVNHVSGNAQGLKLHFSSVENTVPVSRKLTTEVKEALTIDHST